MAARTHYDVLGVRSNADEATIRAAYRRLARDHHPDRVRSSSAAGARDMPGINEAYRVLNDPGRRAVYDSTLRATASPTAATSRHASPQSVPDSPAWVDEQPMYSGTDPNRPARVPWRTVLVAATIACFGVVVLAQFTGVREDLGPDGILRNGDCVSIDPNNDAREVACEGSTDLVVRAFIPFDGTCPGRTEPHRDRQGMGVACIERPEVRSEDG